MEIKSQSDNFSIYYLPNQEKSPTAVLRWALNKNIKKVLALKKVEWKLKDNKTQEQFEPHKPEGK